MPASWRSPWGLRADSPPGTVRPPRCVIAAIRYALRRTRQVPCRGELVAVRRAYRSLHPPGASHANSAAHHPRSATALAPAVASDLSVRTRRLAVPGSEAARGAGAAAAGQRAPRLERANATHAEHNVSADTRTAAPVPAAQLAVRVDREPISMACSPHRHVIGPILKTWCSYGARTLHVCHEGDGRRVRGGRRRGGWGARGLGGRVRRCRGGTGRRGTASPRPCRRPGTAGAAAAGPVSGRSRPSAPG